MGLFDHLKKNLNKKGDLPPHGEEERLTIRECHLCGEIHGGGEEKGKRSDLFVMLAKARRNKFLDSLDKEAIVKGSDIYNHHEYACYLMAALRLLLVPDDPLEYIAEKAGDEDAENKTRIRLAVATKFLADELGIEIFEKEV